MSTEQATLTLETLATRLDELERANNTLREEHARKVADLEEEITRQRDEIARLQADRTAGPAEGESPTLILPASVDREQDERRSARVQPGRRTSRRKLLQLGGAAAAAGVAAAATSFATGAHSAHAAPDNPDVVVPWQTTSFMPDQETIVTVDPNAIIGAYTANDILQLKLGAGAPYFPLGGSLQTALTAYDATGNAGNRGVYATSQHGTAVDAVTLDGEAVFGAALGNGIAVLGTGNGIGGSFSGAHAALYLLPLGAPGAPTSGAHNPGEFWVDGAGILWYCTASGTPGSWVRLTGVASGTTGGATTFLASPIRLVDTRGGAPITNGGSPLAGESTLVVQVTGTSVGGVSVPAGASAVFGNLTAVPFAAGDLTMWPHPIPLAGSPPGPPVSNLNYTGGVNIANFVISKLSSGGAVDIFAHVGTTHVIFDVTGYTA